MNQLKSLLKSITLPLFCIIMGLGSMPKVKAQVTSEGTLFFLGFMGMEINTSFGSNSVLDSQIIYITSKYNTKAYIDNPLRFGSTQTVNITANKVNRVFVLPSFYHPDTSSEILTTASNYAKMGLRVKADAPVYVYCMALEQYRSAATYVLPYAAIPSAPEFYVTSFNPNVTKTGGNYSASEFVIVGMDNNVEVEITPKVRTQNGHAAGTPFTIKLKAGQNYQVRSHPSDGNAVSNPSGKTGDLSGSYIRVINGCGKINVFCGNESAFVGCNSSRDHIYTQCLPTTLLGKNFTLLPYKTLTKGYMYKVTAVKNSTVVKVNGTSVATLNTGETYVGDVTTGTEACITTSNPAYCGQFMKTEACSGGTDADPDLVFVPDNRQTLNYTILGTATTASMKKHYCNILVKSTAKNSLYINGSKVSASSFTDVSCGGYSYYQATFSNPSTNIVESDSGFIAQSYGYGDKESYAFMAGALFENLDYDISLTRPNKCPGAKVDFKALHSNTVKNYTWYFGDGSKDTGKSVSHVYKAPGKYFVNVKIAIEAPCGKVDTVTRSKFVDIFPGPIIDFPDTTTLCGTKTPKVTLDAGAGIKFLYLWQDGSKTQKYNVNAEGKYWCRVTDTSTNCVVKDSTYVRGADNIIAGFKTDTLKHCLPDNRFVYSEKSIYTNDNYGSGRWEYYGKYNAKYNVAGNRLSVNFDTTGTFLFRYIVTSRKGCKDTADDQMVVVDMPTAAMATNKTRWCQKEPAVFYDSSEGPGVIGKSYWDYGNGFYDTLNNTRTHTYKFPSYDTFSVRLITESTWGCRDTVDSTFIVYPLPVPKIKTTTLEPCLNKNKFDFTDQSTIALGTYKNYWKYNNTSSKWTANITGITYTDTGIKKIILIDTSNYGCIDSATAFVHVAPLPKARIGITDSLSCFKQHYFDLADQSFLYSGKLKTRYWRFSDGTNGTATTVSKKKFAAYGLYDAWLIITNTEGCMDSSKRTLTVYYSPQASFTVNDSVQCLSGNSFTFSPTGTTPAGVTQTLKWDFGNSVVSTSSNPTTSYSDTGKYPVKLWVTTNQGCKDSSAGRHSLVQPAPKAGFTLNTDSVCFDKQGFNYTNTSTFAGPLNYKWKLGDGNQSNNTDITGKTYSSPGTYLVKLIASNNSGCADSVVKRIAVHPVPQFAILVNDTLQCLSGNMFNFTNTTLLNSATINTWNWTLAAPGGGSQNFSTQNLSNQTFTNVGTGYVSLDAVTNKGCTSPAAKISLKVLDTPTVSINFSDKCMLIPVAFTSVVLTDPATGAGSHSWVLGDGFTSANQNFSHPFASSGSFKVAYTYTNAEGCNARSIKTINIFPKPKADFNINYLGSRGMQTDYEFTSVSTGAISNDWLFGDNQTFTSNTFKTTFNDTGKMSARLIVVNNDGCADTLTKMLFLKPELQMWIPVSFTPNNDNINDDWGPSTTFGITKFHAKIYDRWGGTVFTTQSAAERWNGRFYNTGKLVPEGVYTYTMSFRYIDGKLFVYRGTITILK